MDQFICGLKPNIWAHVAAQHFSTLGEAVMFAECFDAAMYGKGMWNPSTGAHSGHVTGPHRQGVIPMEVDALQGRPHQCCPFTGNCYNCGKKGHVSRRCTKPQRRNHLQELGNGQGQYNDQEPSCPRNVSPTLLEL
ncbi:hypothetical protein IWQ60_012060 [Tieghemiomyces parasiticus]|uniref:CCHC-type domain-containing protein n=1 Tax=Tieghemiomyces parasiticus TaxID=78921 RepID=A0A9W7ZMC1_9FUNG|nr:hypothetical protein IWQ60_012060 [Tieghemiomyces parasiticus]